jgi:hypothetical protein
VIALALDKKNSPFPLACLFVFFVLFLEQLNESGAKVDKYQDSSCGVRKEPLLAA